MTPCRGSVGQRDLPGWIKDFVKKPTRFLEEEFSSAFAVTGNSTLSRSAATCIECFRNWADVLSWEKNEWWGKIVLWVWNKRWFQMVIAQSD